MGEEFFLIEPVGERFDTIDPKSVPEWKLDEKDLRASIITRLFWAISENKSAFVDSGIKAGLNLKTITSTRGFTVLTYAAFKGAMDVLEDLLRLNLNPAFCGEDFFKCNAFHAACLGGQIQAAERLLKDPSGKITIDMIDHNKQTGLQHAIAQLHFDCARVLIEKGATLNHGDYRGRNALAIALGCMCVGTYDTKLRANNRIGEWETFCLELLEKQSAFEKSSDPQGSHFNAPIQVLLSSDLALHKSYMSKEARNQTPTPTSNMMLKLLREAPKLAAKLYQQAMVNPARDLENTYLYHYNRLINSPLLTTQSAPDVSHADTSYKPR